MSEQKRSLAPRVIPFCVLSVVSVAGILFHIHWLYWVAFFFFVGLYAAYFFKVYRMLFRFFRYKPQKNQSNEIGIEWPMMLSLLFIAGLAFFVQFRLHFDGFSSLFPKIILSSVVLGLFAIIFDYQDHKVYTESGDTVDEFGKVVETNYRYFRLSASAYKELCEVDADIDDVDEIARYLIPTQDADRYRNRASYTEEDIRAASRVGILSDYAVQTLLGSLNEENKLFGQLRQRADRLIQKRKDLLEDTRDDYHYASTADMWLTRLSVLLAFLFPFIVYLLDAAIPEL